MSKETWAKSVSARFVLGAFAALLVGQNGCMTYGAVEHARGQPNKFIDTDLVGEKLDGKPHPAYYIWVPFTIVADTFVFPYELVALGGHLNKDKQMEPPPPVPVTPRP